MSSFDSFFKKVNKVFLNKDIRILSLDVFDTILHRSCPPQVILDSVDRFVRSKAHAAGLDVSVEQVKNARGEAYLRCANKNAECGLDQETHVEDFFPVWMELIGFKESAHAVANEAIEYELRLEERVLYCDPGMVELIRDAVNRNIRVIYCSDMYLPGHFVDRILEKFGILDFFSGRYISSEFKKLKRTGQLFDVILRSESVLPEQVLHVGDNVTSDYVNSKKAGMHSVWLQENPHLLRRAALNYDYDHRQDECAQAFLCAELGSFYTENSSLPYSIGRRFLGPAYTSFIADVIERAKQHKIEKVFFLAREGYALKRVYDALSSSLKESTPPSSYIAGSRIVSLLYSIDKGLSLRHLADIFSNTSHFTINNILSPFSLPEDVLSRVCEKYGIAPDQTLPPNFLEWPPFIRISEDEELNQLILKKAREHQELYTQYLTDVGLIGAGRVMVVDVGWGGQIQDNLFRGLQIAGHEPEFMTGCYLALNEKAHHRKLPGNWKEWSLADRGLLEWNGYSCFDTVFIYEAAVRAPHGTVLGLEKCEIDGSVYPILKSEELASRGVELKDDPALAQLQRGIIDFSESFSLTEELYPDFGYQALKPYALSCISAVNRLPEFREYNWLASVGNVADLGSEKVNVAGAEYSKKISFSLKSAIRNAPWREYVAYNALGIFGVVCLLVVKYGRSIPHRLHALVPGIPFPKLPSDRSSAVHFSESRCLTDAKAESFLYELAENNHRTMCEDGAREATLVSARYRDPLTRKVALNFLVYSIVNISLRLRGRHLFYNKGLAFRYVVKRRVFSVIVKTNSILKKCGLKK